MAEGESGAQGVLVQVCLECGKEYMFDAEPPPDEMECEKCGNRVFRSFFSENPGDEALEDFRDSTDRDTGTTEPSTEVSRGDLHDLGNL